MKPFKSIAGIAMMLCFALVTFSFSKKGGDSFEIFLNGKQMIQQYVHIAKGVQTLQLINVTPTDKLDIYYSHCGQTGTNRVITVKDEEGHLVNTWHFKDATGNRAPMSIWAKDVLASQKSGTKVKLYYSSKELPEGRVLAVFSNENTGVAAKK